MDDHGAGWAGSSKAPIRVSGPDLRDDQMLWNSWAHSSFPSLRYPWRAAGAPCVWRRACHVPFPFLDQMHEIFESASS
eukprot:5621134-Pyramimonas_sp.AAC.1